MVKEVELEIFETKKVYTNLCAEETLKMKFFEKIEKVKKSNNKNKFLKEMIMGEISELEESKKRNLECKDTRKIVVESVQKIPVGPLPKKIDI